MTEIQDNPTDETLSGPAQLTGPDGTAAVADTLTLAEIESTLGKPFKDKATALKAIKDTFSFVGKKAEATQQTAADPDLKSEIQTLKEEVFYANNPQYREQRELIKQFGKDPAEVVATDTFKALFEKVKVADDVAKTKSVITSNARIGQSAPSLQNAVQAANAGNKDAMLNSLTEAILEDLNA
jgi:hypothetical protein